MEFKRPKVSIIMPSLNVAPFIRQCMDSVVKQTLKEIEIFCVDAGSTDGTLEILREYEQKDKRVCVIVSDKKSMGYQYNLGIDASAGEYIGMVETDDWIEPDTFACLYEAAHREKADIVGANHYEYYTTPEIINKPFENLCNCPYEETFSTKTNLSPFPIRPLMWSAIYRRAFLTENSIRFNETPGASYQDMSFHFMVLTAANSIYFLNKYFYHYRKDNEASSVNSGGKVNCIFDETAYYEAFLETRSLDKARLIKPYMEWKQGHYNWNYNRILPQFQWEFLMRFRNEFLAHREAGLLEERYFPEKSWKNLNEMLDYPILYFKKTCKNKDQWLTGNLDAILRDVPEEFCINRNGNRTLAFISTYVINRAVISEYRKLSKVAGCDCLLVIDNSNLQVPWTSPVMEKEFFNTKVTCFFFDKTLHDALHLPCFVWNRKIGQFSEIMWYNSDYRFYYVRKIFPGYDYYLQFDYDIFCNGDSYQPFFDTYAKQTEDLLVLDFRKEQLNGNWHWSKNVDWNYKDLPVYGSLFTIVRLTGRAVDFLYGQRLKQKELIENMSGSKNAAWPFCELFVPTELVNNGFTAANMEEKQITWDKEYDLNEARLFEHPDNLLYHPVKGQFIEREQKLKAENAALQTKLLKLQKDNKKLAGQFSKTKKEITSLKKSRSFRIGRLITLPLRMIRDFLK